MPLYIRCTHIKNSCNKINSTNNEDTPAKCKLNTAKSTEPPECDSVPANGGYNVQPVPTQTLQELNLTII